MSERIKITDTLTEWQFSMAGNKSDLTIKGYVSSIKQFIAYLEGEGMSTLVGDITTRHIRMFLAHLSASGKQSTTIVTRWCGIRAYFKFAVEQEILDADPSVKVVKPDLKVKALDAIGRDDIKRLLEAPDRKTFRGARDYVIMRLLTQGLRRGEIAGIRMGDEDLSNNPPCIKVLGKGNKERYIALNAKDAMALSVYLRKRKTYLMSCPATHPALKTDAMFVSKFGAFSGPGIEHMLNRYSEALGIERANAHSWRHYWAGEYKARGGSDDGLMALGGWSTNREIKRYTAHVRSQNAMQEAQRLGMGMDL